MSSFNWLSRGPFTVFDLETTGMSPTRDRIIEIGAVRVEPDGALSRYQTLVNPGIPLPSKIAALTGISQEMVSGAPSFADVVPEFLSFLRESRLIAHNARFDLSFLQESLARTENASLWSGGAYDTLVFARKAFPGLESYSLPKLSEHFGLDDGMDGTAHRALFDAEITMKLFKLTMDKLIQTEVQI